MLPIQTAAQTGRGGPSGIVPGNGFVNRQGLCLDEQVCLFPCPACVSGSQKNLLHRALWHSDLGVFGGGPESGLMATVLEGVLPLALAHTRVRVRMRGLHPRCFLDILVSRNRGQHGGSYTLPFTL